MSISLAQSPVTSTSGTSAAYGSNNASGNILVAVISLSDYTGSAKSVTGITDTRGNTWTRIDGVQSSDGLGDVEIWYVPSCAAGANTVAAATSGSAVLQGIAIYEINGANATPDQHANAVSTSSSGPFATITPSANGAFIVAGVASSVNQSSGPDPAAGTGFTLDYGNNRRGAEHQIQSTAGSTSCGFTGYTGSDRFETVIVSFVPSGGGGGGGSAQPVVCIMQ